MMKGCETISNVFMLEKKKECYSLNVHLKTREGERRENKTRWRGKEINNQNKAKIDQYHAAFY